MQTMKSFDEKLNRISLNAKLGKIFDGKVTNRILTRVKSEVQEAVDDLTANAKKCG